MNILSIDAWRDVDGWTWNNWHKVGTIERRWLDATPRQIFAMLRAGDYLTPSSAGRVALEDDGYNLVIIARGTREPLLALAYGEDA